MKTCLMRAQLKNIVNTKCLLIKWVFLNGKYCRCFRESDCIAVSQSNKCWWNCVAGKGSVSFRYIRASTLSYIAENILLLDFIKQECEKRYASLVNEKII